MSILIVDDSPVIQELLKKILQIGGYKDLLLANSTNEGFEILGIGNPSKKNTSIDLILMDITMPGINGIEACRQIKGSKGYEDIPIIMVTAAAEEKHLEEAFSAGATDYVTKPLNKTVLLSRIRSALKIRQNTLEIKATNEKLQEEINERKKAEEALKRSEETLFISEQQYRLLFENNPQPMWVFELVSLKFLAVNEAAVNHYGYSQEEFLSMTLRDIWFLESINSSLEDISKASLKFSSSNVWKHKKKDQTIIDVEVATHTLEFAGKLAKLALLNDITARKQAEDLLIKSEERYRNLFNNIPIGMYRTTPNGQILMANPSLVKMLGYSSFEDFSMRNLENKEESLATYKRSDFRERIERDGEIIGLEAEWIINNNKSIYVRENSKVVRGAKDEILYYEGTIEDITQSKIAEHKLQQQAALLDITQDAIIVCSLSGELIFWNKGAERIYGWTAEEALGKNTKILYKNGSLSQIENKRNFLEKGTWLGELNHITKNGKEILVESQWVLVTNEKGRAQSILIVNTDITERKKLETQFLRAQRLESLGTLAAGIAHDLNNVLTPITMSVSLLKRKLADAMSQKILLAMENSTERGVALIKQVLSFARGIEGEHTLIEVKHVIAEIEHIITETFPKSITISVDIPREKLIINGNATQLHQVLLNLCVNARDAMPNGGNLSISVIQQILDKDFIEHNLEIGNPYVIIKVTDTGNGIEKEIIDKIFDPFFTTKELGKGTGLGLSTVLGITKSHSGAISVESELKKGTTFTLYLPCATSATSEQREQKNTEFLLGKGETILVIDDEESIRRMMEVTLSLYNYKVLVANDGAQAIDMYMQNQDVVKVILTDLMMPNMDGVTAISILQKINPLVKVLAVSGVSSSNLVTQANSLGVKHFLSKPYSAEELLVKLQEILKN
jgi:PAS domain S-box-containing protein